MPKFLHNIDMNGNQLINAKLERTDNPLAEEGVIHYHDTNETVRFRTSSGWVTLGTSDGDMESVTLTGGNGIGATNTNSSGGAYTSTISLDAALTTVTSIKNNSLIIGGNSQNNTIDFGTDDVILFDTDSTERMRVDAAGVDITGALTVSGSYNLAASDIPSLAASKITSGTFAAARLASDSVITAKILDGNVTTVKIAGDAITNAKIADGAVDTEHLAADSITAAKIDDGAVGTAALATNAVTTVKITDANITTAKIADDNVTAAKLADTSVSAGSYTAADITVDAQGRITSASSGAIGTSEITDNAVTLAKMAGLASTKFILGDSNGDPAAVSMSGDAGMANTGAVTVTGATGNFTVGGNLTVSGTTTTVNSTTVSIADPIFELGADGSDDNLDRGLKMKYNSSGAKIAFMGFDDSTGKFTMIPDATDSSSVFSGTAGTLVMTTFEGALTGNVTGNTSGSAGTVTDLGTANSGDVTFGGTNNRTLSIGSSKVTSAKINTGAVTTAKINDDAVTAAKLASDAVVTASIVDDAVTNAKMADNAIGTAQIANDAVTEDKLHDDLLAEIDANTLKVTNATHTGEVTGSGALTIANDVVDEANLKVSNAPTNGYYLTAQSGNTGGLTWAAIGTLNQNTTGNAATATVLADGAIGAVKVFDLIHGTGGVTGTSNNTTDSATWTITHGMGASYYYKVEVVLDSGTYDTVYVDVTRPTTGTVKLDFGSAVANGAYRAMLTRMA